MNKKPLRTKWIDPFKLSELAQLFSPTELRFLCQNIKNQSKSDRSSVCLMNEYVCKALLKDSVAHLELAIEKGFDLKSTLQFSNKFSTHAYVSDERHSIEYFALNLRRLNILSFLSHHIDYNTPVEGVLPLFYVLSEDYSKEKSMPLLKLLLTHGANPNSVDVQGESAAYMACVIDPNKSVEALNCLIEHGLKEESLLIQEDTAKGDTYNVVIDVVLTCFEDPEFLCAHRIIDWVKSPQSIKRLVECYEKNKALFPTLTHCPGFVELGEHLEIKIAHKSLNESIVTPLAREKSSHKI